jgi:hypothetical protein
MTLTWHVSPTELSRRIETATLLGITKAAQETLDTAYPNVPVITGTLRGSGVVEVTGPLEVVAGYTAPYAPDVEYGHGRAPAKLFLTGAMTTLLGSYERIIADEIRAHI